MSSPRPLRLGLAAGAAWMMFSAAPFALAQASAVTPAPATTAMPTTPSERNHTPAATSAKPTAKATKAAVDGGANANARTGRKDRIDLDAAQITGNRELPKVLYIVPWKRPDLGDLQGKPANSLLDEVLAPVDRDVFKRENRYFQALQSSATTPAPPNGATAAPAEAPAKPAVPPPPSDKLPIPGKPES